jgi:UDP-N-acetylmuramoyl-tripeptide--D-alanyl-D-alanine ligase
VSVPFRAADVARWTGGRLVQGDPDQRFTGASIDTRTLAAGALFVAIRGEHHDAHGFLADAVAKGAAGLLVEAGCALPPGLPETLPVLAADDTTGALGALGAGHRAGFDGAVVAITGSNGKTTTKELCAAILGVRGPCLRTPGNWNNNFGVPLTLLLREPEHRALVVEMGMNHRGEIAPLVALARPSVGLITNVGTAHIENLGSREEIALEKGDLVAGLAPGAVAVLNADDPFCLAQAARTRARVVTFGQRERADVGAEHVKALGERGFAFDLVAREGRVAVHVPGIGETMVINSLAAAAAALAAGAHLDDVATGLARYRPVGGRMEQVQLPRNIIVINDTYNANPQSMAVALRSLAELKGRARGLAVLGDMAELGESAPAAHRETGRLVAELAIEHLFALGRHAEEMAEGARAAGMDPARIHVSQEHAQTSIAVREILQGDDWVLVKGSRSSRMERVVEALARDEAVG